MATTSTTSTSPIGNSTVAINNGQVTLSGLSSGLNTDSIINAMVAVESQPLTALQTKLSQLQAQQSAYDTLGTKLSTFLSSLDALRDSNTFNHKTVMLSDNNTISVAADTTSAVGTYNVQVLRTATPTFLYGAGGITSTFPTTPLDLTQTLNVAPLKTAITGASGGSAGSFSINGVSVSFDTSKDTMNDVISRINNSSAGVVAMYDKTADRMVLTNKDGGAENITVADAADGSNFMTAVGLAGQAATLGQTAQIQVGGFSGVLTSNDNIFTPAETGLTGVTITAVAPSAKDALGNPINTTITLGTDNSYVVTAFQNFATAYEDVMQYISDESVRASSTSSSSTSSSSSSSTSDGPFVNDQNIQILARTLRSMIGVSTNPTAGKYTMMSAIGVGATGTGFQLTIDTGKLNTALNSDLGSVMNMLNDPTNGLISNLDTYVMKQTMFSTGIIKTEAAANSASQANVSTDIGREQQYIDAYKLNLQMKYAAMETAMSNYSSSLSSILSSLG